MNKRTSQLEQSLRATVIDLLHKSVKKDANRERVRSGIIARNNGIDPDVFIECLIKGEVSGDIGIDDLLFFLKYANVNYAYLRDIFGNGDMLMYHPLLWMKVMRTYMDIVEKEETEDATLLADQRDRILTDSLLSALYDSLLNYEDRNGMFLPY